MPLWPLWSHQWPNGSPQWPIKSVFALKYCFFLHSVSITIAILHSASIIHIFLHSVSIIIIFLQSASEANFVIVFYLKCTGGSTLLFKLKISFNEYLHTNMGKNGRIQGKKTDFLSDALCRREMATFWDSGCAM